jgi:hypothetical protein
MGVSTAQLDDLGFGMLEMLDVADLASSLSSEQLPINDPSWPARSRDLHTYLATGPKTWEEIERWGAARRITLDEIRCQIIVLEDAKKVKSIGKGLNLKWQAKTLARKRRAA